MIDHQEILELARELRLTPQVIEKDYVLGWLLAGIHAHPRLGKAWVFKGGTCLKKCYFETYRFSEDLDFTLRDPGHLDREFLVAVFTEISEWVYERSGIEIPKDSLRFDVYDDHRGRTGCQGRVAYRGPNRPRGDLPRIKLDLTDNEVLVLDPVVRVVHHSYSDAADGAFEITAYAFEEIFAEKVRALTERLRPRDLYDVIHLARHESAQGDRTVIHDALERKCAFKGVAVPVFDALEARPERAELETEWANMLRHQLPTLPPIEHFWGELPGLLQWLYEAAPAEGEAEPLARMGSLNKDIDESWTPPAWVQPWHTGAPLEMVRFAAANRLCVDLQYNGSWRTIEPYSVRRTRDDNLLLYAVRNDNGGIRAYRVDRIEDATVTDRPFTPRYAVELAPGEPISAPDTARGGTTPRPTLGTPRRRGPRRSRRTSLDGPRYVFECTTCGRRFTKKKYDSSLNKHKDRAGNPCLGRMGVYVETKYP